MFKELKFSWLSIFLLLVCHLNGWAQQKYAPERPVSPFSIAKEWPATAIKNQGNTGTCWSFSGTSLLESQFLKSCKSDIDLSEMYTVRNIYLEKAKNYVLRQGKAQFSEGGLGHDVIRAISLYGAMPDVSYTGLVHKTFHDHSKMIRTLKEYVDSIVNIAPKPLASNWITGYEKILDDFLGKAPSVFDYKGKSYSPLSFATDVLKFKAYDYVMLTSFTHHPYYAPFILEVPDNFSNGSYLNLPLQEMVDVAFAAVEKGYTLLWDADVSNDNFRQQAGLALLPDPERNKTFDPLLEEVRVTAVRRQELFENLTTQDDHLMHIVGVEKTANGKRFFKVKNSWGNIGPYEGYIMVSESYFALNTISLVLPRGGYVIKAAKR